MQSDTAIIVMLKAPVLGRVKTRLARTVGEEHALVIYNKLVDITLQNVQESGLDAWLAVAEGPLPSSWIPYAAGTFSQQGQDLGQRMKHAVETVLNKGYQRWLIIGGDCPGNRSENMVKAANLLQQESNGVVGPTEDGGYYMLGMNGFDPVVFAGMEWGSDKVFEQTMRACNSHGLEFVNLPILRDVDTIDDLYANNLEHLLPPL